MRGRGTKSEVTMVTMVGGKLLAYGSLGALLWWVYQGRPIKVLVVNK